MMYAKMTGGRLLSSQVTFFLLLIFLGGGTMLYSSADPDVQSGIAVIQEISSGVGEADGLRVKGV